MWFLIGIGGFLVFIEGAIAFIARRLIRRISEDTLKVIAGIVIYALAIVFLLNLPAGK
jgi:hypothetical protein